MNFLKKLRVESPGIYWTIVLVCFGTGPWAWPIAILLIILGIKKDKYEDDFPYKPPRGARGTQNSGAPGAPGTPGGYTQDAGGNPAGANPTNAGTRGWNAGAPGQNPDAPGRRKPTRRVQSEKKFFSKTRGTIMMLVGAFFGLIFAFSGLGNFMLWMPDYPLYAIEYSYIHFILAGLFILLMVRGILRNRRANRCRVYMAMLKNKDYASVSEIAARSSVSNRTVKNDLQDMIETGILGDSAWLDYSTDSVILNKQGFEAAESDKREKAAAAAKEDAEKKANAQKEKSAEMSETIRKNQEILAEIRKLDEDIENEHLSEQIVKIEKITKEIFAKKDASPEKNKKLRSFFDYYLPTTLKMLRKYRDLEDQEVKGENITLMMSRIEQTMENIVAGFEKQLDNLYQNDMLDISSDIAAMEQMMAKDGLSGPSMSGQDGGPKL